MTKVKAENNDIFELDITLSINGVEHNYYKQNLKELDANIISASVTDFELGGEIKLPILALRGHIASDILKKEAMSCLKKVDKLGISGKHRIHGLDFIYKVIVSRITPKILEKIYNKHSHYSGAYTWELHGDLAKSGFSTIAGNEETTMIRINAEDNAHYNLQLSLSIGDDEPCIRQVEELKIIDDEVVVNELLNVNDDLPQGMCNDTLVIFKEEIEKRLNEVGFMRELLTGRFSLLDGWVIIGDHKISFEAKASIGWRIEKTTAKELIENGVSGTAKRTEVTMSGDQIPDEFK